VVKGLDRQPYLADREVAVGRVGGERRQPAAERGDDDPRQGEEAPDAIEAPLHGAGRYSRPLSNRGPAALDATDKDVSIGGAGLAAAAIELGLVDELRIFRYPVVVGGGTPFLPPVTKDIALDLIETRTFGSRVIYERYGRAHDESD
jgi:hypothetical protein